MTDDATVFPLSPATVIFGDPDQGELWSVDRVIAAQGGSGDNSPPMTLLLQGMNSERSWPIESVDQISYEEWSGVGYTDDGSTPWTFQVRGTTPRDAESSITLQGFGLPIPLPVELIGALVSDEQNAAPELFALTEDDGFVGTLLLSAPTGLYVRYSNQWITLADTDLLDGLTVYEVGPSAVDLFDVSEQQGSVLTISAYTVAGGEDTGEKVEQPGDIPGGEQTTDPMVDATDGSVPVTAGVLPRGVPSLSSADDVEGAIAAAADNPDLQWWVERRLTMLGIEAELPWLA